MAEGTILDRLTGLAFLLVGLGAIWHAQSLVVSFSSDPVGPKVFPTLVGGIMAAAGATLFLRPNHGGWEGGRWMRVVIVALASLVYPELLIPLGFVAATSLMLVVIGRALGASWVQALSGGIAMSACIFLLIDTLLGLPLPTSPLGI